ncbi:pfh1, partial [Symbiodinium natans]
MAPCHRCSLGIRRGRGQGWCSNPQCRQAEKEELLVQQSAEKIARQQQRAAQGAGSRGPLREADCKESERRQLHAARARAQAEEGAGGRGPLREEDSKRAERRQLHEARAKAGAEEGASGHGPLREEDSKRAERRQLHEARARAEAEEEAGRRGPLREEDSKRAERRQLHEARARAEAEEEAGRRGPLREEDSKEEKRRQLHEARVQAEAEEGVGGRGPRPIASEIQQQGYPFPDEDTLTQEQAQAHYLAFARSWSRFGLSRVCQKCQTLTPGRHCKTAKEIGQLLCRNCRENRTKVVLPTPAPIPEALQSLQPIEQHLLAMARISQVLLDKLPSGGPSAQWGRMYAVLMQDPFICDVLEGATLEEDGTVLVEGVDGMTASPARLEYLHAALQALKELHCLYQRSPAVDRALARMAAILANKTSAAAATPADPLPGTEANQEIEMTYLVPKQFQAPKADAHDLRKVRGSADLSDGMDAKFFPHLFPTGTGGWQNDNGSFSQYARKRLLSVDARFEASTAYIMWLLEMQTKKRLSGNINVRIGNQRAPYGSSDYENGSRQVYTALRDMPGTQPYLYAKKGVALNMYEQLGAPNFFMTLSCHARQPALLLAAISARLLRLHPDRPHAELEQHAAEILFRYQNDKSFTWDGLSPNQLCNQQPAVVARQFMHQVSQLMWWLSSTRGSQVHLHEDADPQDGGENNDHEDAEDDAQAPATDSAGLHRRMRKEWPPFK